jgi:protoporphyrinogen IX oxidase
MLWLKSFHIIFVVTWYAGLFYLPRLFVYHTLASDEISVARFKVMERKLYYGIMTPSAVLAVGLGLWLMFWQGVTNAAWMHAKLFLVLLLVIFHMYLGVLVRTFAQDQNKRGHVFYRWINEIPAAPILFAVVILVVVKPF